MDRNKERTGPLMPVERGPNFDRFLMRLKDFLIIGTAIAAMLNWALKRSEGQEQRMRVIEDRLVNLERVGLR